MQGVLFRIVNNEAELNDYHAVVGEDYILQDFVQLPFEFSVFHIRYPGEKTGIVTGFVAKEYLQVIGDGKKMLGQLVSLHPLAKYKVNELKKQHAEKWNNIVPANSRVGLTGVKNQKALALMAKYNHAILAGA